MVAFGGLTLAPLKFVRLQTFFAPVALVGIHSQG